MSTNPPGHEIDIGDGRHVALIPCRDDDGERGFTLRFRRPDDGGRIRSCRQTVEDGKAVTRVWISPEAMYALHLLVEAEGGGWRQFAVATEGPPSDPPDCELP